MQEQHLSSSMRHRVMNFFDYLWVRNKGTDRQSLLHDMPYCMQAEVSLATTENLLREVWRKQLSPGARLLNQY